MRHPYPKPKEPYEKTIIIESMPPNEQLPKGLSRILKTKRFEKKS